MTYSMARLPCTIVLGCTTLSLSREPSLMLLDEGLVWQRRVATTNCDTLEQQLGIAFGGAVRSPILLVALPQAVRTTFNGKP